MNMEVPLTEIVPNPWQTRWGAAPEHIKNLALDIAANGLLQTPVGRLMLGDEVAPVDEITAAQLTGEIPEECRVQLAFGHNRLAAFKWLQDLGPFSDIGGDWSNMPVELKPLTDEQMAAFAWSENEKRRELSPIERAMAILRRIQDFGWSHEDAAENLGISRPSISNALRLLKLPEDIQDYLHAGKISERQAMALLKLFEQPEDLVDDDSFQRAADHLVRLALEGESSERLRQIVESTVDEWKLNAQPKLMDEPEPEPLSPRDRLGEGEPPRERWSVDEPPRERQGEGEPEELPKSFEMRYRQDWPPVNEPKPAPLSDIGWNTVIEPAEAISASPGPYQPAEPQTETLQTEPEPELLSHRERLGEGEQTQEPEPVIEPEPDETPEQPQAAPAEKAGKLSLAQSTFTLTITLWPHDGDPMGRLTMLGARINEETPIMTMLREKELTLPPQMMELVFKLGQAYEQ